ncbi:MAG: serine/threonine protein kinase [Deltaproteobacteria bacterium]|nr:serine/threonine protein kinase [Deltaproteobacteria bacterium]
MAEDTQRTEKLPSLLGPFRIHGVLGEGGSGTVYDAEQDGRHLALKVLRLDILPTGKERERFLGEARRLGAIDHPGVVRVAGTGVLPDGRPYLATEKIEGESLAARVAREPLPLEDALAIFDGVAAAVAALHAQGLVHRDIKPENVLVAGRRAVLVDLGIAKPEGEPASTTTQAGVVRGTPAYMAPERFFGVPAGVVTDVYELAVVLYLMFVGRLPWSDLADPSARLNPPAPSALGCNLPPALEAVLLRALSTRAEARPAGVEEFARLVREAAQGAVGDPTRRTAELPEGAFAATPHPAAVTSPRPTRRRTVALLAAAGVVAATAAAAGVLWAHGGDAPGAETGDRTHVAAKPDVAPVAPAVKQPVAAAPKPALVGAALLPYVANDATLVTVVSLDRLRRTVLWERLAARPPRSTVFDTARDLKLACGVGVEDVHTALLAVGGGPERLDFVLAGDLPRDKVEACLRYLLKPEGGEVQVAKDGSLTEMTGRRTVRLAWPAEGVVVLSTRPEADAAWLAARVEGRESVRARPEFAALFDELDREAAVWAAAVPVDGWSRLLEGGGKADGLALAIAVGDTAVVHAAIHHKAPGDAAKSVAELNGVLEGYRSTTIGTAMLHDAAFEARGTDAVFAMTINESIVLIALQGLEGML